MEDQSNEQSQPDTLSENEKLFSMVYFGFASNLSPRSLQQRCPGSLYIGLATLKGWRFIISESGFGNIVRGTEDDIVYGSLYFLTRQHEEALDQSEEVPWWHKKMTLKVRRVAPGNEGEANSTEADDLEVTTYVDIDRTKEGIISKEYLVWMRKAIADGLKCGVPQSYFEKYVQKFLPEDETVGHEDKIIMQRTVRVDKDDLRYVPQEILSMMGKK